VSRIPKAVLAAGLSSGGPRRGPAQLARDELQPLWLLQGIRWCMDANKGVNADFLKAIRENARDDSQSDAVWKSRDIAYRETASADDSPGALIDRWNKLNRA
jgi:hypothetical protein